ncbi:septum formation family protein [Demequina iriomotensis]|uniref:septum formation family protein n=1 Tax=Demequina iriomotensis TaxID=1536641 RepID=UPI000782117C|nr:septum formation family protein [Demequina iriomotensis]
MTEGFVAPPMLGDETDDAHSPAARRPGRAPRRRVRGRRLAWIVGGAAALAIGAGVLADVVLESQARGLEPAERGATGRLSSVRLVAGLCLADAPPAGDAAGDVTAVACDAPHHAESIAAYSFASDAWPGDDAVAATALDFCAAQVARLTPDALAPGLDWRVWAPSLETWERGDRTAVCLVTAQAALTGSLERGDAAWAPVDG